MKVSVLGAGCKPYRARRRDGREWLTKQPTPDRLLSDFVRVVSIEPFPLVYR
jgi:hypothetical protein